MRIIEFDRIKDAVCAMCGQAACDLPDDVLAALQRAKSGGTSDLGREFFDQYLLNSQIARKERLPLCQDTGFAVFFVQMGSEVMLDHGTVKEAINAGVKKGYKKSRQCVGHKCSVFRG